MITIRICFLLILLLAAIVHHYNTVEKNNIYIQEHLSYLLHVE